MRTLPMISSTPLRLYASTPLRLYGRRPLDGPTIAVPVLDERGSTRVAGPLYLVGWGSAPESGDRRLSPASEHPFKYMGEQSVWP
jgi:hypothetical protein